MWTLKFRIRSTVTFFTAVIQSSGPLGKQRRLVHRGQKVMLKRCDWRISIHSFGFCIFVVSRLSPYPWLGAFTFDYEYEYDFSNLVCVV